jgi:RNA polymerase sigma factor (sigma-70 family)
MERYGNQHAAQPEARFSPRAQRERELDFERAQRIMEVPLEYVRNPRFEAWSRDKKTESEVLGPMPARGGPRGGIPAPAGVAPYLASLYEMPLLTREQEVHLFRKLNYLKYKASVLRDRLNPLRPRKMLMTRIERLCREIIATRNQIICANLRLVVSIAKRHAGPAQNFFELVSDGNVSLMRAAERFDYSLGNRFSTYATWAIINNFSRSIPESLSYRNRFRTDSLELFTATPDIPVNHHELEAVRSRREMALDGILRKLNDREREIIVCRFGLRRDREPQTLQEVGDVMGVSKERIRQIEARALGKLRRVAVPGTLPGAMRRRARECDAVS